MTGEDPLGKRALYSAAARRPGTVLVDCSSCGGSTRISYFDLARAHVPLWLWAPWRRHSRFARCPVCDERTWLRVNWLG